MNWVGFTADYTMKSKVLVEVEINTIKYFQHKDSLINK